METLAPPDRSNKIVTAALVVIGIMIVLLLVFSVDRGDAANSKYDAIMSRYLELGWVVVEEQRGDLTGDTIEDRVLILNTQNVVSEKLSNNMLVILVGLPKHGYQVSIASQSQLRCSTCAGVAGGPWPDISIEGGKLIITSYGGSRERWIEKETFVYQGNEWVLQQIENTVYDTLDPDASSYEVLTPKDFGRVTIQ